MAKEPGIWRLFDDLQEPFDRTVVEPGAVAALVEFDKGTPSSEVR
jgi:hypothetical protein